MASPYEESDIIFRQKMSDLQKYNWMTNWHKVFPYGCSCINELYFNATSDFCDQCQEEYIIVMKRFMNET